MLTYPNEPQWGETYYVDGTKRGQRKFKRYLRRKGICKQIATKLAHTVYVDACRNGFLGTICNANIHLNFSYHFNRYDMGTAVKLDF